MGNTEMNSIVKELRELHRMAEELAVEITTIEDTIMAEMTAPDVDTLTGGDEKMKVTATLLETSGAAALLGDYRMSELREASALMGGATIEHLTRGTVLRKADDVLKSDLAYISGQAYLLGLAQGRADATAPKASNEPTRSLIERRRTASVKRDFRRTIGAIRYEYHDPEGIYPRAVITERQAAKGTGTVHLGQN